MSGEQFRQGGVGVQARDAYAQQQINKPTPPSERPHLREALQDFSPIVERLVILNNQLSDMRTRLIGDFPEKNPAEVHPAPQNHIDTLLMFQGAMRALMAQIEDKVQHISTAI